MPFILMPLKLEQAMKKLRLNLSSFSVEKSHVICVLLFSSLFAFGQEKGSLSIDWGSWRTKYLYPVTNIRYDSPYFLKNVQIQTRLRSYGTLFFASKDGYDFSPIATYRLQKKESKVSFHLGFGTDVRIRLVNDSRAHVSSSAEPIIYADVRYDFGKWQVKLPLWNRYYANGIGFSILPEIAINAGKKLSIFSRFEANYMAVYNYDHAFSTDVFIGLKWKFLE